MKVETEKRRAALLGLLKNADSPLTGAYLAASFKVSRQIIVQDIAILRAAGEQVLATPQGYLIMSLQRNGFVRTVVACRHGIERIEEEIGIVVDFGGKVLDVIVEHPVYGEIRGNLMISSRRDLTLFLACLARKSAQPLSVLTEGVHLHTLEVPSPDVLHEITGQLRCAGLLIE